MLFTRSRSRSVASALVLLALVWSAILSLPATAVANPLHALSIVLMYESNVSDNPTLVISARLPDDTPLPAEMILPLPENANVLVSSEYFPEGDRESIPVEPLLETRDGVPVVILTLTESRIGLVDVAYIGSRTITQALGGVYDTGFDLTLPTDAANVYAAIAIPSDVEALEASEVISVSDEPDGNTYHYIERTGASAGDKVALTLQVQEVVETEWVDETVPWMVAAVVAVIIGAAVLLLMRRRPRVED